MLFSIVYYNSKIFAKPGYGLIYIDVARGFGIGLKSAGIQLKLLHDDGKQMPFCLIVFVAIHRIEQVLQFLYSFGNGWH